MNLINKTARSAGSSKGTWGEASMLALAGGVAFWVVNFAISLTPIAAEFCITKLHRPDHCHRVHRSSCEISHTDE